MRIKHLAFILGCIIVYASYWICLYIDRKSISSEGELMENVQAICLAAGMVSFVMTSYCTNIYSYRIFYRYLALLYASMFILEFDVGGFMIPIILKKMWSGSVRNISLMIVWIIATGYVIRNIKEIWKIALLWMVSQPGQLIMIAVILYLLSVPFDKSMFNLTNNTNQLIEEVLDANAALLMVVASLLTYRSVIDKKMNNLQ